MYMKVYYLTWSVAARQKKTCVSSTVALIWAHAQFLVWCDVSHCVQPGCMVQTCRTSCCTVPRVLMEHNGRGSRVLLSAGVVLRRSSTASRKDLANSFRSMSTINKERFKTCAEVTDGRLQVARHRLELCHT